MYSVAIWSQSLAPGKRVRVMPEADVKITTMTFGESLVEEKGRSTIKLYRAKMPLSEHDDDEEEEDEDEEDRPLEFEDQPIILGHLVAGRVHYLVHTVFPPLLTETVCRSRVSSWILSSLKTNPLNSKCPVKSGYHSGVLGRST